MLATLGLSADPQSENIFSGDYSGVEFDPDDVYHEPKEPDILLPDLVSDSSFITSGSSDSSTWDPSIKVIALDAFSPPSSCQMQGRSLFRDESLANDGMLRPRENGGATCADPDSHRTIDPETESLPLKDQEIPKIFSPIDLTKQELGFIPPDPRWGFIGEYGECFLPYLVRCCCSGSYAWGEFSIWGHTLEQIDQCSVGTYLFSYNSHVQKDVQVTKSKFKVIPNDYCPDLFDDVCCKDYVSTFSLIIC